MHVHARVGDSKSLCRRLAAWVSATFTCVRLVWGTHSTLLLREHLLGIVVKATSNSTLWCMFRRVSHGVEFCHFSHHKRSFFPDISATRLPFAR